MNELEEEVLEPVKTDIIEESPELDEEDILMTDILKQKTPPQRSADIITKPIYVLGFAISPEKDKVLLIQKNRPQWQEGLLNGIGGKIEGFDATPSHAMEREFREETGLTIEAHHWRVFTVMEAPYFKLTAFWATCDYLDKYTSVTDEIVHLKSIDELFHTRFAGCVSNLSWLIGMLTDSDIHRIYSHVQYRDIP